MRDLGFYSRTEAALRMGVRTHRVATGNFTDYESVPEISDLSLHKGD
jgi:putative component of toxin-antitoxin plasmid stabilization module